jgi:Polyphosphate kinase C-terminal domain 2
VPVDLNVRGISCLRPGIEGVSDNIRVVSVVGRFLEHSRIFGFRRGDEWSVYIGSADLMPRNLDKRVELVAPVEAASLRGDLLDALERCLADDTNAWDLHEDGTWERRESSGPEPHSVHKELMLAQTALAEEAQATAAAQAAARGDRAGPRQRAHTREPQARAASRSGQRRRRRQSALVRLGSQRHRPARDVRPLVGAHPDRR